MSKFNFFLLDWDGCLAKTLNVWMDAYKKIFKNFGFQFSEEEIVKIFGDWEGPKKIGVKDNETFIKNLQLEIFFDVLLTEEDVVKHKPDPEIVDKSMSLLKAIKTETIIVGDSQKDILAGQAAKIATALFFPEEN